MRRTAGLLPTLVAAAGVLLPGAGFAQVVRERPVPIDSAGAILELGAELRRALGLFPDEPGFLSARLFESDTGYVLEITLRDQGGGWVRERRPLETAEVAALRSRVSAALAERGSPLTQEGRPGLVLTATALGLGYYGWATAAALDLEERGAVGGYLVAAGTSFLVPYLATRNRPVTIPRRNAAAWGATRGVLYGLALGDALTGGEEFDDDLNEDEDVILASGVVGSVVGGLLGFAYGGRSGVDEGYVAFRATMGDFALAYGFGTATALGLYDTGFFCQDDLCFDDSGVDPTPEGHLTSIALGVAGTWAAGRWPSARGYTLGDTRALRSFGILGAQAAWPLHRAVVGDDGRDRSRSLAAATVLGSAAGLVVGDRLLRDRSLSSGDGLLVLAGHVAGGLGALGVTYLLSSDEGSDHDLAYLGASALGSLAGSLFTLRAVGNDAASPVDATGRAESGARLEIAPLPLALASLLSDPRGAPVRTPLVTVRF